MEKISGDRRQCQSLMSTLSSTDTSAAEHAIPTVFPGRIKKTCSRTRCACMNSTSPNNALRPTSPPTVLDTRGTILRHAVLTPKAHKHQLSMSAYASATASGPASACSILTSAFLGGDTSFSPNSHTYTKLKMVTAMPPAAAVTTPWPVESVVWLPPENLCVCVCGCVCVCVCVCV